MTQKTITLTLSQATNMLGVLQRLMAASIRAKYSFVISRNFSTLTSQPDVVAAEQTRVALVRKFGAQDEQGNIRVPANKLDEFAAEFAEIAARNVEVKLALLPVAAMDGLPDIAPSDMLTLDPMWEEETTAEPASDPK